ncbi:hypothetical protein ACEPAF_6249 [Sanghuangporus sanghuang]
MILFADVQMSVFRQDGDRRSSHRRDTNAPVQAAVPRSRTPHPTRDPVIAPATYGYPVQPQVPASSGGGVSPQGWDELYGSTYPGASVQDTPHGTNIYGNIPPYGQTSAIVNPATSSQTPYNTPSQWIVQFNYDSGREPRQVAVPIQRHQVPELQCLCGTHIRIVHLPTLVNWIPPFGVLWNFKLNDRNGWLEGNNTNACISATGCPRCKAYITLHGPTTGGTS